MENSAIKSFRDLDTWRVAMDLAVACYAIANRLPASERFELNAQLRRAAVSVPSNVAEGHASGRPGVYSRHVHIALGSTGELETLFELVRRLQLLTPADLAAAQELLARTGQLLHGLARSLRLKRLRIPPTASPLEA